MFGTFEEEKEKVVYGVVPAINSVNPIKVFLHGFPRLFSKMKNQKGFINKFTLLFKAP